MNQTIKNFLIFTIGAAIGSVATWKMVKTKYEQISREEIESMKNFYHAKSISDALAKGIADGGEQPSIESILNASKNLEKVAFAAYNKIINEYKEEATMREEPYVIPPEEFGETGYETVSLNYFADGVLTDELDEPIEDVESMVGEDSLTHFGEFEDDSVFVRNEEQEIDYEILLDNRKYSEVYKS